MKRIQILTFLLLSFYGVSFGQNTVEFETARSQKVLFVGNSYTSYNNLPLLVANLANAVEDTLTYTAHTPGGARLRDHYWNDAVGNLVESNEWNYVVLQGQSQETSWAAWQVNSEVRPFAGHLSNMIRENHEPSMPLFYMTWGRKNGDADNCGGLPWVCTYEGMDDEIRKNYLIFKEDNNASVSPVSAVWRYLRENHPEIELYSGDGSHPSAKGSFAAACTFYAMIFKKDPTLSNYNFNLNDADANLIKSVAKDVVFNEMQTWQSRDLELDYFAYGSTIKFYNQQHQTESSIWDFGDGNTSTKINPTHTYVNGGTYDVKLTKTDNRGETVIITKNIEVNDQGNLVAIPDAGFRAFLQENYPDCFEGDSLNTACAYTHPNDSLIKNSFEYTVNDLTGIQHFNNLKYLSIKGNANSTSIKNLSILPENIISAKLDLDAEITEINFNEKLEILDLSNSDNTITPNFPNGLRELYYNHAKLVSFNNIPDSLRIMEFSVVNVDLTSLGELPDSLVSLTLKYNVKHISSFPDNLKYLTLEGIFLYDHQFPEFSNNLKNIYINSVYHITGLPELPEGLENFTLINGSKVTSLPDFPSTLKHAVVNTNYKLTQIPDLPDGLITLNCKNNSLTSLPETLPSTLEYLNSSDNQIFNIPELPQGLKSLLINNDSIYNLTVTIPEGLETFECSNNGLSSLPELPNTIKTLKYNNNNGILLTSLPDSLETLNIQENNISCVPVLPEGLMFFYFRNGNSINCLQNIPANSNIPELFPVCEEANFPDNCFPAENVGDICENPIIVGEGTHQVNNLVSDQWYKFTSTQAGELLITTCGLTYEDTKIELYKTDCDNLVASNDDECFVRSRIQHEVDSGEVYLIKMDDSYTQAVYQFSIQYYEAPGGETCQDAIRIQSGTHQASNAGGVQWFEYKMPANGQVNITTCDLTDEDTYLEIYSDCGNYYDESDDDCDDYESDYTITNATEGTVYKLAWLDEYTSGTFPFQVSFTPDNPDYCDNYDNDTTLNVEIEDSYLFGGDTLTESGTYEKTFISSHECDSIVTLNLTILNGKTTPVITWNTPQNIPSGTPLGQNQLNATASVHGSFTYSPAIGSILAAGTHTLSVDFLPADLENYLPVNGTTVSITIDGIAAPTNFIANTVSSYQINLSWDDVEINSAYVIERSTTPGAGFAVIAQRDDNSVFYADTNLEPNTSYYYRIKALYNLSSSEYSQVVSATTYTLPPQNFTANVISDVQIDLNWDDVTGETSYTIQRAVDDNANFTDLSEVTSNSVSYSDNSTVAGNTYFYRIRANNNGGSSEFSNEIIAETSCGTPTNISSSAISDQSVTFNWDAISGANGYEIVYGQLGNNLISIIAGSDDTNITVNGLYGGSNYQWRIRTICTDNQFYSGFSSFEYFSTTGAAACDVPTNTSVSGITNNAATFNWTEPAEGISYQIQYGVHGSNTLHLLSVNAGTSNFNLTGLFNGTNYQVRIRTICTAGELYSQWSDFIYFSTSGAAACNAPTGVNVSGITDNSAVFNWTEPAGVVSYEIVYGVLGSGLNDLTALPGTSSINLTGLFSGTTYQVRIRSICTSGQLHSQFTNFNYFTTSGAEACSFPLNLNTNGINASQATSNWDVVAGADSYHIVFGIVRGGLNDHYVAGGASVSSIISGLNPGTNYRWRMRTICNTGQLQSSWSGWDYFTTSPAAGKTKNFEINAIEDGFNVYPNPSDGVININFTQDRNEIVRLIIYNAVGSQVYFKESNDNIFENTDLNKYGKGMYLIRIINGNKSLLKRVVIK